MIKLGIYDSYIGWFDGISKNLRPLSFKKYSENILELAGIEKIAMKIHEAIEKSKNCDEDLECIHSRLSSI